MTLSSLNAAEVFSLEDLFYFKKITVSGVFGLNHYEKVMVFTRS